MYSLFDNIEIKNNKLSIESIQQNFRNATYKLGFWFLCAGYKIELAARGIFVI